MEQLQYYISKLPKPEEDKNMNIHSPAAPVAEDKHPTRPELAKNYPEANVERKDCKVGPESSAKDAYNIRSTGVEEA